MLLPPPPPPPGNPLGPLPPPPPPYALPDPDQGDTATPSRPSNPGLAGRRADGTFAPGNPGKRPGTRNRATVILQTLFEDGATEIGQAVLLAVRRGDMTAARIAVDRLYPVRRGTPIEIPDFPKLESAADVPKAHAALVAAVMVGQITAEEAKPLSDLLTAYVTAVDIVDTAAEVAEIKRMQEEARAPKR